VGISVLGLGDGTEGVALLHRDEARLGCRRGDTDAILHLGDTGDIAQGQKNFLLLFLAGHLAGGDHLVALDADLNVRVTQAYLGHMLLERFGGLRLLADQRFPQLDSGFFDKREHTHGDASRSLWITGPTASGKASLDHGETPGATLPPRGRRAVDSRSAMVRQVNEVEAVAAGPATAPHGPGGRAPQAGEAGQHRQADQYHGAARDDHTNGAAGLWAFAA